MASLTGLDLAVKLISMSRMSSGELIRKLLFKGESEESARYCAERLTELGLLDDRDYAISVVRHYATKGYGESHIRSEFKRRLVPSEYWDEALEHMPNTDEIIHTLISKKLTDPHDKSQIKKICDSLCRRGFSYSEIRIAMDKYIEEEELF